MLSDAVLANSRDLIESVDDAASNLCTLAAP
jgi:hypothetical protein